MFGKKPVIGVDEKIKKKFISRSFLVFEKQMIENLVKIAISRYAAAELKVVN
jgi:hypothetical protein